MVRQPIITDASGAVYFMMQHDNGNVSVLRTDPNVVMGEEDFVRCVYKLRS